MSSNIVNQTPFLETSRRFPEDELSELAFQTNLAYVDIASAVNAREIGLFPTQRPALTGQRWFVQGQKTISGLRQVYTFTSTSSIPHNVNTSNIYSFSHMYGVYTDGTNWYGLIAGTSVAIAGVISFYVTPTQIVFSVGAGAPALTSGQIVLEWLSNT